MSPLRARGYQSLESRGVWPRPLLGTHRWRGWLLARSWLEWPCEEGHLANACKSATTLESSKVLGYYLSGGSILVSSGPGLASRQLQRQGRETHGSAPRLLCKDMPPPGRAAQGKPRQPPWGNTFLQTPEPGASLPIGGCVVGFLLPALTSLLPSPQHLSPGSSGAFWHPSAPSDHVLSLHPFPRSWLFPLITGVKAAHGGATCVNGCTKQRGAEQLTLSQVPQSPVLYREKGTAKL